MRRIADMPRDELGRAPLTAKQRRVLDVIRFLTVTWGYPPTVREVQAATGERSINGTKQKMTALRRKGWITWAEGYSRTVQVIGE